MCFSSTQYCHYVAGLVGIGLSQLFSASQLEDPEVGKDTELANSMGLFLQKTNIIRDYLEDTQEGRAFWPQEVETQQLIPHKESLNLDINLHFVSRIFRFYTSSLWYCGSNGLSILCNF